MKKIEIVNMPGYTSSYYVLALSKSGYKLHVKPEKKFEKYNYATCLLIRIDGKLIVIDNDDPLRVIEDLYEESTVYFMTNKAIDKPEFNRDGIYPLFPHYPVNTLWLYIKLFHWHLMKPNMLKKALTVLYTVYTRPKYVNFALNHSKKRYVFFAARFWKKEKVANEWRLAFMEACTRIKELHFEGGFQLRKDITYPEGFEKYVNTKSYNPSEFSRKSSESIVVFNNPAVKDAISWRVAEYLNAGKAIISVPFKMELPKLLLNEQEVLYADNPEQLNDAVNELVENDSRRMALEKKAKMYFDKHCTPEEQIRYILDKANFK